MRFKNQISATIIDTFPLQHSWRLEIKMNVTGANSTNINFTKA